MNKSIVGLGLCAFLCAGIPKGFSQQEISHKVDFPQDGEWTVTFSGIKNKTENAPSEAETVKKRKKVDIVRKRDLRRDIVTWSDGTTTTYWWSVNPLGVFYESGSNGHISAMKGSSNSLQSYDASSFTWVNEKTFLGMKPFQGKQCQFYETEIVQGGGESFNLKLRAWIDPKTQRPEGLMNGFDEVSFSFKEGAVEELKIPENFQQRIKQFQAFYSPTKKR
jgi:hypothetical protein